MKARGLLVSFNIYFDMPQLGIQQKQTVKSFRLLFQRQVQL